MRGGHRKPAMPAVVSQYRQLVRQCSAQYPVRSIGQEIVDRGEAGGNVVLWSEPRSQCLVAPPDVADILVREFAFELVEPSSRSVVD